MKRLSRIILSVTMVGSVFVANNFAMGADKASFESAPMPFAQDHNDELEAKFSANKDNPELGLAWVRYLDSYKDDMRPGLEFDSITKVTSIEVPGLSYKADSDQIIYKKPGGNIIVCATDINIGKFTPSSYKSTGKCDLKVMKTKVRDFRGHEEWAAVVTLVTHD